MDEVDEALDAFENGDSSHWVAEALALEVRCNRTTIARLRTIEQRAADALRGNASETDEYERGWIDACAEILGR
jgi:hypothetical protein